MDLASQFIFLVIFGIIGFIIGYFTGFNLANLFSNIGAIVVILPAIFIILKEISNPEYASQAINDLIKWLVDTLPGVVISDAAGAFVGAIAGEMGGKHGI